MEGLGGIVAENVRGNDRQVAAKLVATIVERTRGRPRDSCAMKRQVSERDDIVITAMVEEELRNWGNLLSNVARQLEIVEVPPILIPRRGSKQEYASNWFLDLLLC